MHQKEFKHFRFSVHSPKKRRVVFLKKILIVNYEVGGGYAGEDLPRERLAEGYALMRACVEEFALAGLEIYTTIDKRLIDSIRFSPIHNYRLVESHKDFLKNIQELAEEVDYCLALAPETRGILKDLATIMKNSSATYLGPDPEAIEIAANKLKTLEIAKELEVSIPTTVEVDFNENLEILEEKVSLFGYPLIVKPIDGRGCRGLLKIYTPDDLRYGLSVAQTATSLNQAIVQEYIEGLPISVSLLVGKKKIVPLSINRQSLKMDSRDKPGKYLGGEVPIDLPERKEEIFSISEKLVKRIGIRGFVGIDFVMTDDDLILMEINPRITVPFIALRNLSNINLALLLIQAQNNFEDIDIKLKGYAAFSQISIPSPIV
jgi:hypothetical protein